MTDGKRVSDGNKTLVQRFFDEVINGGNIDLIDELLTDDFVEHEELPGLEPTRDGVKEFFRSFRNAFPDGSFTPEEMIAEGDTVAVRVTIRGTPGSGVPSGTSTPGCLARTPRRSKPRSAPTPSFARR